MLNLYGHEPKVVDELFELIKQQLKYKRTAATRLYSPQGIQLFGDDVMYLRNGDIVYYDYKGRDFDSKQVVDMYEREALIGEGGFGRVYRGRHKESGEIVALKYQDLGSMSKQNDMQSRSLH